MKKYTDYQSYEDWAAAVSDYELTVALDQIALGVDAQQVLADLSRRIVKKMLHPIFLELKPINDIDMELLRENYNKIFKNRINPADHIEE